MDKISDAHSEDFRKSLAVMALLLSTFAGSLVHNRVPTRLQQLQAMQFIDYVILFNSCTTWVFTFFCGIVAALNSKGISCSFAAYFSVLILGVSKMTVLLLMSESLHYIHSQMKRVSKRQDKQYLVHITLAGSGFVFILIWSLITIHGHRYDGICHMLWNRTLILCSLAVIVIATGYLSFRCCCTLLRTEHTLMRAWAYRYISGFLICSICSLLNFIFMAVSRGQIAIFVCLTAYLLDAQLTIAAIQFLLHPSPIYKRMDDFGAVGDINLDSNVDQEAQDASPSIFSRAAPSYRTRQDVISAKRRMSRVSCSFVSGATPQGIAAYLSQIDQDSTVLSGSSREGTNPPRHVNLLPSHPQYAEHKWPKPMYSHYPNYSVDEISLHEEHSKSSEEEEAASARPGEALVSTVLDAAARARFELFACDEEAENDPLSEDNDVHEVLSAEDSKTQAAPLTSPDRSSKVAFNV